MKPAKFLWALSAAAGLLLPACRSAVTYPKEKIAEKLAAVCKNEYNLDVKAQVVKTTLGVQVEIPGLIDELRRYAASSPLPEEPPVVIEGKYTKEAFDFRMFTQGGAFVRVGKKREKEEEGRPKEPAEPMKKMQHVSTAILRACLSTDAPLEFYRLIARDPGPDRRDVILSGHILDSKRVQFYAISMGEMQNRNEFTLRHQPEEISRATVAYFVADLSRRPLQQLLSRYTARSKRFGELLPMVMAVTMDLKGQVAGLKPEEWPARQIEKDVVLVYLPLKQVGGQGAYLFSVHLEQTPLQEETGTLLAIEKLEDGALPAQYRKLGPPEEWSKYFYLEPLSLPEFMAEQIAKRVMSEYKLVNLKDKPTKKEPAEEPATIQDVTKSLMGAAAYVTSSYDFKQFREVSVVDGLKGTRWVVPSAELSLYRRRDPPELKPIP